MTAREWAMKLLSLPNPDADLNFKVNLMNSDCEDYDVDDCSVEIFNNDEYEDVYDIMVSKEKEKADESISCLFETHDTLNIKIKKDDTHDANVIVSNQYNEVLREIKVTPKIGVLKMDAILCTLQHIL